MAFTMNSLGKSSSGKNFYITLDQPPDYIFKDGDIVSGKCSLFSSIDEDVGSIVVSFHGTVKAHIVVTDHTIQASAGYQDNHYQSNFDSEDVLFSESKIIYRGLYTLRKNVLYEWPFQFQFPSCTPLPPSGNFRKDHWNSATISYEIEACRGRTSQEVASLEKRITPVDKYRDASTQSRTLFELYGSFTGMVSIAVLRVSPPKRSLPERSTVTCQVERQFIATPSQLSGSHHRGISGIFHHQIADAGGNIIVRLPSYLVHDGPFPILLAIETSADVASISLHSIDVHFQVFKTVISSLGRHRQIDESKITLFTKSKVDSPLAINSTLDICKMLKLQLDSTMIPSFVHSRVELHYDLQVQLVLEGGGRKFKEEFLAKDIQIDSNRMPNSPLRRDHLCVFLPNDQDSSSAPPIYPGIEKNDKHNISSAYLRLSRILTHNFIPHSHVSSQNGETTIKLYSGPHLSDMQLPSSKPISMNPFSKGDREDALVDDQHLLDIILTEDNGFKPITMRSDRATLERFSYSWLPPIIRSLKERVRGPNISTTIEISAPDAQKGSDLEAAPPSYSNAVGLFSPFTLLNRTLDLIATCQLSDESLLLDVEYAVNQIANGPQVGLGEIDVKAASGAVAKFENLRAPLRSLQVEILSQNTDRTSDKLVVSAMRNLHGLGVRLIHLRADFEGQIASALKRGYGQYCGLRDLIIPGKYFAAAGQRNQARLLEGLMNDMMRENLNVRRNYYILTWIKTATEV